MRVNRMTSVVSGFARTLAGFRQLYALLRRRSASAALRSVVHACSPLVLHEQIGYDTSPQAGLGRWCIDA